MNDLAGKRAARMLRVSTTGQSEDNQDRPTADYIADRGMAQGPTYRLHGASASKGKQVKAVREAIEAARRGEFDVLVIRAIDRLDRRGSLQGWLLLGELLSAGVTVLSAEPSEAFLEHVADGTMPMVGTLVSAKLDLAHEEVKAKQRRIDDVFRVMDDSGYFRGAPPAGYATEGEKRHMRLVPAAERRDVIRTRKDRKASAEVGERVTVEITVTLPSADDVRQAFTDAETVSTVTIGKRLGMTPDAVAKMLRNKVYSTGMYPVKRKDGVTAIHRCEPLVTPAVQNRAIAAVERRRTGDNVTSRALAKDDFSGALYCAACDDGGAMHRYYGGGRRRSDGSKGPKVRRYRCTSCGKSVDAGKADAEVHAYMSARNVPYLTKQWVEGDDHSADLERVGLELRELPGRGLDRHAEQAERERLWAEQDRLEALPSVAGHWEGGFTGMTEGARWAEMAETSERRAWLVSGEFRIYVAAKPGRTGAVTVELVYVEDREGEAA